MDFAKVFLLTFLTVFLLENVLVSFGKFSANSGSYNTYSMMRNVADWRDPDLTLLLACSTLDFSSIISAEMS